MKVPLSLLNEFIKTNLSVDELAETLTNVGLEVDSVDELFGVPIFDVALTPNLAHCASVRGIARELSAITGEKLHVPKYAISEKGNEPIEKQVSVRVEDLKSCPRYACRFIQGVRVGPSPSWLQEKIEMLGLRSVNNVVDITNLVLMELGHPLHAFDFDTLEGREIVVRTAKKNEKITTLDENELYPNTETLLICDSQNPVAIAGVMGSLHTEVTESTKNILLESAYFDPTAVRRASSQLGIKTEASYRFERGVDPNGVLEALERATSLICEIAGGSALKGVVDIKSGLFEEKKLTCRLSRANRVLGTQLAMSEVETIYKRLEFGIVSIKEDLIEVSIPTYRHDIHQEIDLIEEIARLYGFNHIHNKEPVSFRLGSLENSPEYEFEKKVRQSFLSQGLQELLTCDLISPHQASLIDPDCFPKRSLIKLLNPHSVDQSVLRPTLLPGMLSVIKYNADHGVHSVAGFEIGRVHFLSKENYLEPSVVSVVLAGERYQQHWESKEENIDFFDLKGLLENVFEDLKVNGCHFVKSRYTNFHPERQALVRVGEIEIGIMGEIHPSTLKKAGVHKRVYFAELNLEDLSAYVPQKITMEPLAQYPSSARDWTITTSEHKEVGTILDRIKNLKSNLLESVSLLDVYRSDKLGSGRKNVTLRFIYRDRSKTVSVSDVEQEHCKITENIADKIREESS